ncbi:multidrug transporter [Alteromonas sediminis]|uniref:Multidrug transporter n=1 Tax=Alteromonas sediminis TaxID=2259342 RepID=A0A3N5Y291_9ALTE|nr:SapC family protein [Alteromonas sediminis]RPJ67093.1 multidrug transporter [Alteromonas sediminis]
MSKYEMLNNVAHADLKIRLDRAAELGDDVMFCMTYPFEFRLVLSHYPILVYRDKDAQSAFPVALFGFEEGENLFLSGSSGWNARYIPIMVQRQPFSIGFQQVQGSSDKQQVITFNPAHPRVNREVGESVFNEYGGYTPYLDQVVKMLESIDTGHEQNRRLIEALDKYNLLEESTIAITLKDGTNYELVGFSTIADDRFEALSAEALDDLNKQKLLLPITMIMASMSNLGNLVDMRNAALG